MAVLGHLRLVRLSECVFPRRQGRNELRSQTLLAAHALRSLAHTPLVTARLAFLLENAVKRLAQGVFRLHTSILLLLHAH